MFTGIIKEVGIVTRVERTNGGMHVHISAPRVLSGLFVGDSVAVNGVCLTVKSKDMDTFKVEIMPETLRKTHFNELEDRAEVNIEPSLQMGDVVGGHWVQAHVDDIAEVVAIEPEHNATLMTFRLNKDITQYVVHKGFIGVEGASLTVVRINDDLVTVSLVEHTMEHTTFRAKRIGDRLNIEVDVLAKYVEKIIGLKHQNNSQV